jgi:hypothetical protein
MWLSVAGGNLRLPFIKGPLVSNFLPRKVVVLGIKQTQIATNPKLAASLQIGALLQPSVTNFRDVITGLRIPHKHF